MPNNQWYLQAPEHMRLSLENVLPAGCDVAEGFTGDYCLNLVERTPKCCRWELNFPVMCDLFRIELKLILQNNNDYTAEVMFEGTAESPLWKMSMIQDIRVPFNAHIVSETTLAGATWPEKIFVHPMRSAHPVYNIPVDPSPHENPIMLAMGAGSCDALQLNELESGDNPLIMADYVIDDVKITSNILQLQGLEIQVDTSCLPSLSSDYQLVISAPNYVNVWNDPNRSSPFSIDSPITISGGSYLQTVYLDAGIAGENLQLTATLQDADGEEVETDDFSKALIDAESGLLDFLDKTGASEQAKKAVRKTVGIPVKELSSIANKNVTDYINNLDVNDPQYAEKKAMAQNGLSKFNSVLNQQVGIVVDNLFGVERTFTIFRSPFNSPVNKLFDIERDKEVHFYPKIGFNKPEDIFKDAQFQNAWTKITKEGKPDNMVDWLSDPANLLSDIGIQAKYDIAPGKTLSFEGGVSKFVIGKQPKDYEGYLKFEFKGPNWYFLGWHLESGKFEFKGIPSDQDSFEGAVIFKFSK